MTLQYKLETRLLQRGAFYWQHASGKLIIFNSSIKHQLVPFLIIIIIILLKQIFNAHDSKSLLIENRKKI